MKSTLPTPEYEIKPLTADHLHEVVKIEKASFSDPWPESAFRNLMIQTRNNWAILIGGDVAGYLVTQWVLDEIHILNLAVSERFRRRGLAAALMSFLIKSGQKKKSRDMYLEVRASNDAARALYAKFGFSPLGMRKSYYADGEDAMVLHKRIPRSREKGEE
ncbi:ribosomal protein S18-alanine N-acetyltransferase [bacterium]|nr:ribosomal protein S18-alanine N-acetyltransferase [bacterium]MBU1638311.1 ribosomal protein S18-alanine N-acetyltransferase [bacterium]